MSLQLAGKVAIVTGAARGLGAAVVRLFVTEGAQVIVADVDEVAGEQLAREFPEKTVFERLDVSLEPDWERVIAATINRFGKLDVLVNNAAVIEVGSIETQTTEQWRRVNSVIADGAFFGCKHAVRAMKKTGGGNIVNVASVGSLQGEPYALAYSAAKGAVESLTRAVAVHCVQNGLGIRCNSLHPGPIRTPMVKGLVKQLTAAVRDGSLTLPANAAAESYSSAPEEIATSVLYLASDASRWVNGTRLVVDNTASVTRGHVPP
jgi:3(or 17)beta-hydroxysteroid dehydrogenase